MDILSFRFNKNNQIFILQYLKTNQSCIDLFDIILCENLKMLIENLFLKL